MDGETELNGVCRGCGCNYAMAAADAKVLGVLEEFLADVYTCCQVVQWADEQWAAWHAAAIEDGKPAEEVTTALEVDPEELMIPVYVKKRKSATDPRL